MATKKAKPRTQIPSETITGEKVVCDCPDKEPDREVPSQDREEYFTCVRCAHLQHRKCHDRDESDKKGPLRLLYRCNQCRAAEIEQLEQLIKAKNEQAQAYAQAVERRREALNNVIIQVLWRQYCLLPNTSAPPVVKEASALNYENGKMVPKHPEPASWKRAIETNLAEMMEACGKKLTDVVADPNFFAEQMNVRILTSLREIAFELVHRGTYKRNRGKLGALGEVLGLESKGAVWKG